MQCGLVYVQNARPGGGAATAIAGYADRIFRFLDTLGAEAAADEAAKAAAATAAGAGAAAPAAAATAGAGAAEAARGGGGVNTSRLMSRAHGESYFIFDQVRQASCALPPNARPRLRLRARPHALPAGTAKPSALDTRRCPPDTPTQSPIRPAHQTRPRTARTPQSNRPHANPNPSTSPSHLPSNICVRRCI